MAYLTKKAEANMAVPVLSKLCPDQAAAREEEEKKLKLLENDKKAREFMQQTGADKRPNGVSREDAALWTFEFDTFLGCKHVNLIDRHDGSLRDANGDVIDANSPAEAEWLFSPYSARPHAQTRDRANTDSLFESNAVV
jgi:hypothetical protein